MVVIASWSSDYVCRLEYLEFRCAFMQGPWKNSRPMSELPHPMSEDSLEAITTRQRIHLLQTLEGELGALSRGGKVYKRQENSNVFFVCDPGKVLSDCKKEKQELLKRVGSN